MTGGRGFFVVRCCKGTSHIGLLLVADDGLIGGLHHHWVASLPMFNDGMVRCEIFVDYLLASCAIATSSQRPQTKGGREIPHFRLTIDRRAGLRVRLLLSAYLQGG